MSTQRTLAPAEKQITPWNPYQLFAFVVIASTLVIGIALGINWKRLKKPEWQVKTILLSILVPVVTIGLALAWVMVLIPNRTLPIQLILSVPYLAMGVNFGYVWALARLQNGAYRIYEARGPESLSSYEYDLKGAVIFGVSVALLMAIGCTLIFPLLNGR